MLAIGAGGVGDSHYTSLTSLCLDLRSRQALRTVVETLQPVHVSSLGIFGPLAALAPLLREAARGFVARAASTYAAGLVCKLVSQVPALLPVKVAAVTLGAPVLVKPCLLAGVTFSLCPIAQFFYRVALRSARFDPPAGHPDEAETSFPRPVNDWSGFLPPASTDTAVLAPDLAPSSTYDEPLCSTCLDYAPLEARHDPETRYCFFITVPTSCQRCKRRYSFSSCSIRTATERRFHISEAEANLITALSKAKEANPKRNLPLGLVTYLEGSSKGEERKRLLQAVIPHYLSLRVTPRLRVSPLDRPYMWSGLMPTCDNQPTVDEYFSIDQVWRRVPRYSLASLFYEVDRPAEPTAGEEAALATGPDTTVEAEVDAAGGVAARQSTAELDPGPVVGPGHAFPALTPSEACALLPAEAVAPAGVMRNPDVIIPLTGPAYGNPVVYDHRHSPNRIQAAGVRMATKCKFAPGEEMRARLDSYDSVMLKRVFSKSRIISTVANLPFFAELGNAKLTPDKFLATFEALGTTLPERYANIKLEATAKPAKVARLVYDEGLPRTVINTVVAHVFEEIYFSDECFGRASIKHVPREEAISAIVKECSSDPPRGHTGGFIEVDQTGFEYHQTIAEDQASGTLQGLMVTEMVILTRIFECISEMHINKKCYAEVLAEMAAACVTAKGKPDLNQEHASVRDPFSAKIKTRHFFRTSGHRLTSGANHYQEMRATVCVHLKDPGAWLTRWLGYCGRNFNSSATLGHGAVPLTSLVTESGLSCVLGNVFFRPWMEGDDAAVRVSGKMCTPQARDEAAAKYAELGLDAKVKNITGGSGKDAKFERLEFVGEHIMVLRGKTLVGRNCADVKRAFTTCSANASGTPPDQLASKYYSKALTLTGIPFAAQAMAAIARHHAEQSGTADYADGWQGSTSASTFASLKQRFDDKIAASSIRPTREVADMLACSLEAKVTANDISRADSTFTDDLCTGPGHDVRTLRDSLPKALAKALQATF